MNQQGVFWGSPEPNFGLFHLKRQYVPNSAGKMAWKTLSISPGFHSQYKRPRNTLASDLESHWCLWMLQPKYLSGSEILFVVFAAGGSEFALVNIPCVQLSYFSPTNQLLWARMACSLASVRNPRTSNPSDFLMTSPKRWILQRKLPDKALPSGLVVPRYGIPCGFGDMFWISKFSYLPILVAQSLMIFQKYVDKGQHEGHFAYKNHPARKLNCSLLGLQKWLRHKDKLRLRKQYFPVSAVKTSLKLKILFNLLKIWSHWKLFEIISTSEIDTNCWLRLRFGITILNQALCTKPFFYF